MSQDPDEEDELQQFQRSIEPDLYSILNSTKDATFEELKSSYKKLTLQFHPDKGNSPINNATEEFNKINKAYNILSNHQSRIIYDEYGSKGLEMKISKKFRSKNNILQEYQRINNEKFKQQLEELLPFNSISRVGFNISHHFINSTSEAPNKTKTIALRNIVRLDEMYVKHSYKIPICNSTNATFIGSMSNKKDFTIGIEHIRNKIIIKNNTSLFMNKSKTIVQKNLTNECMVNTSFLMNKHLEFGYLYNVNITMVHKIINDWNVVLSLNKMLATRKELPAFVSIGLNSQKNDQLNKNYELQIGTHHFSLNYTNSYIPKILHAKKITTQVSFSSNTGLSSGIYINNNLENTNITSGLELNLLNGALNITIELDRSKQKVYFPVVILQNASFKNLIVGGMLSGLFILGINKYTNYLKYKRKKEKKDYLNSIKEEYKSEKRNQAFDILSKIKNNSLNIKQKEEDCNGLVILEAIYKTTSSNNEEFLNVTIQLQNLVNDSKLFISKNTKLYNIPGIYDPSPSKPKTLIILYKFKDKTHKSYYHEHQDIILPLKEHSQQEIQ